MKKKFIYAEDAEINSEEIKSALIEEKALAAVRAAAKQTRCKFPSSGAVAAKQTGRQKAFTLAETLIALTIIGIIAAITVPALVQRTNKQEYVTALQKAYSTLSQATQAIIAENGSPKGEDSWLTDVNAFYNMYKKYLNNAKECGADNAAQKCFTQYGGAGKRTLVLADGTQILFENDKLSSNCNHAQIHHKNETLCAYMFVDINGAKKPNKNGRDIFSFFLKEDGLYPSGCSTDNCPADSFDCTCKVLREGKMDY